MDSTFVNSERSKTSHPHRLLLNLTDKIDFRRAEKSILLSNLSVCYNENKITKAKNGENVPYLETQGLNKEKNIVS